jgi:ligand-binding sensor domain-containing protein
MDGALLMTAQRRAPRSVSSLVMLLATAACSASINPSNTGPGPTSPKGGTTGSLTVTMTLPAGVSGAATVSGPGGYAKTVSSTGTLTGLTPGTYAISAAAGMTANSIVGVPYIGSVTGSPATVAANTTTNASVSYAQRASQGMLWTAQAGSVVGFAASQLASSGSPPPTVTVHVNATEIVVDATGGIWASYFEGDTVYYYTQAQLLAGGSPTATIKIGPDSKGSLSEVTGLALDAQGDLWVGSRGTGTIVEFTPQQLASSGSPTPKVTLSSVFGSIDGPWQMSFDAKGHLWVANASDSTVSGFSPSQLAAGGPTAPAAGISLSGNLAAPFGLAFDSAGDLWVASLLGAVGEFTPNQLTGLSAATPAVVLNAPGSGAPSSLAFDESGGLWVFSYTGGLLWRYSPAQLQTSGTPTPNTTLTNNGGSINDTMAGLFSPHSDALPLH